MIKKFFIWLGRISFLTVLVSYLIPVIPAFIYLLILARKLQWDYPVYAATYLAVIVSFIPWVIIFVIGQIFYGDKKKNWRIAIDEARKFAEENKLTDQPDFLYLFEKTKITQKPMRLNIWIENYKKWQNLRKEIGQLERKREELPQQIVEKTKEWRELRGILFSHGESSSF